jgi:hypothetical protein
MKNLTIGIDVNGIGIIEMSVIALQVYDRKEITKEQLSKIIEIDFDKGERTGKGYPGDSATPCALSHLVIQLYDRELITKNILLKMLFGMEAEVQND